MLQLVTINLNCFFVFPGSKVEAGGSWCSFFEHFDHITLGVSFSLLKRMRFFVHFLLWIQFFIILHSSTTGENQFFDDESSASGSTPRHPVCSGRGRYFDDESSASGYGSRRRGFSSRGSYSNTQTIISAFETETVTLQPKIPKEVMTSSAHHLIDTFTPLASGHHNTPESFGGNSLTTQPFIKQIVNNGAKPTLGANDEFEIEKESSAFGSSRTREFASGKEIFDFDDHNNEPRNFGGSYSDLPKASPQESSRVHPDYSGTYETSSTDLIDSQTTILKTFNETVASTIVVSSSFPHLSDVLVRFKSGIYGIPESAGNNSSTSLLTINQTTNHSGKPEMGVNHEVELSTSGSSRSRELDYREDQSGAEESSSFDSGLHRSGGFVSSGGQYFDDESSASGYGFRRRGFNSAGDYSDTQTTISAIETETVTLQPKIPKEVVTSSSHHLINILTPLPSGHNSTPESFGSNLSTTQSFIEQILTNGGKPTMGANDEFEVVKKSSAPVWYRSLGFASGKEVIEEMMSSGEGMRSSTRNFTGRLTPLALGGHSTPKNSAYNLALLSPLSKTQRIKNDDGRKMGTTEGAAQLSAAAISPRKETMECKWCSKNGKCIKVGDSYRCECDVGFTGTDCSVSFYYVYPCDDKLCSQKKKKSRETRSLNLTINFLQNPKESRASKNSTESHPQSERKANHQSQEFIHNIVLGICVGSVLISLSVITGIGLAKARGYLMDEKYVDV